jgi:hypothetical protein
MSKDRCIADENDGKFEERIASCSLMDILEIDAERRNGPVGRRIGQVMRRIGWKGPHKMKISGYSKAQWGYRRGSDRVLDRTAYPDLK